MKNPNNHRHKNVDRAIRACGYRLKRGVSCDKNLDPKGYSHCGPLPEGVKCRAGNSAKLANIPLAVFVAQPLIALLLGLPL